MRPRHKLIGIGVLLGALASCAAPRGTATNTFRGQEGASDLETTEGNPRLLKNLEIVRYQSERRDGYLRVQFDLQNKKASDLKFEWTIDWFDASGFRIDTQEHWTPIVIAGKGFKTLSVVGPTTEASVFRLQTRTPNTVRLN